jgi:two-component system, sensor histidine kinase PdtaS
MQKILVVDNNPVALKYMESFLSKNEYNVKTAENGLIALDLLKEYIPDIIFVDLIMPYIQGDLLVSILRRNKELSKSYIIILSGVAAEVELDYLAMGADACIAKGPFSSMSKHIISTLNLLLDDGNKHKYKDVFGLEGVYKRSITKELMIEKLHGDVILQSISDSIVELSMDLRIVYMNNAALGFLHLNETNIIASNIQDQISSEWYEQLVLYLNKVKAYPLSEPIELHRDENCFLLKAKYLDSSNNKSIILIIKDISSQKQREEYLKTKLSERELMIKEVYHRVKNNLAMISSIINLQMHESRNENELNSLHDLRSRIDSISMVHAKLFRGKNLNNISLDEYIADLVDNLIDSLSHLETSIIADVSIPDISIDFDKAVPLGIVITELTTNAIKYAFTGLQSGIIAVRYIEEKGNVIIEFSDNGHGLSTDLSVDSAESLGFNLITSLVLQLQGELKVENKNGAVFTIILPRL